MNVRLRRPPVADLALAGVFLLAGEVELLRADHLTGDRPGSALVVAVMMASLAWRREAPLVAACIAGVAAGILAFTTDISTLTAPMVVLFVPPYSVARHAPTRRRAVTGGVVCLIGPMLVAVVSPAGGLAFNLATVGLAWTAGRVVRGRQSEIRAQESRRLRTLAAETDRQRLVVRLEQNRIARELQAIVVASVSDMVVQAETAARVVDSSPAYADACMSSIELTARQVLADMRRVLGMLRTDDGGAELEPLPGLAGLGALRGPHDRQVRLQVEGTSTASASLGLAVHRIVETALAGVAEQPPDLPLDVSLAHRAHAVDVFLAVDGRACPSWPTGPMQEWLAACNAVALVERGPEGERLAITIPVGDEVPA